MPIFAPDFLVLSTAFSEVNLGDPTFFSLIVAQYQRRQWHPTPVLLPGKSHGQRSLVGCSSWGREESDTTERLHFHFSLPCIGEGNGNLLQCSCLENPRDRGAWWTAVYEVAWSQTRLKWLRSSSSRWDWTPWSLFSECWALSQLFHSPLSISSSGPLVLHFLP